MRPKQELARLLKLNQVLRERIQRELIELEKEQFELSVEFLMLTEAPPASG